METRLCPREGEAYIFRSGFLLPLLIPLFFASLFLLSPSPLSAQEKTNDEIYPYALGGGAEVNLNTREGIAMGYGAAVDRYISYAGGKGILLAGVKASMQTDFGGISGTEAGAYLRLNLLEAGPGFFFSQLGWGYSTYREDAITANAMLMDFTLGYRGFFLNGFYFEPYFRTGFPFRMGFGLMAGHWFAF